MSEEHNGGAPAPGDGQGQPQPQPKNELDGRIAELEKRLSTLTDDKARKARIAELEAEINELENPQTPQPPKPEGGKVDTYNFDQMPVGYAACKETSARLWEQMTAGVPNTAFVRQLKRKFVHGVTKETIFRQSGNKEKSREFIEAEDAVNALNQLYGLSLAMPVK